MIREALVDCWGGEDAHERQTRVTVFVCFVNGGDIT